MPRWALNVCFLLLNWLLRVFSYVNSAQLSFNPNPLGLALWILLCHSDRSRDMSLFTSPTRLFALIFKLSLLFQGACRTFSL
jgi:hypothetical protein